MVESSPMKYALEHIIDKHGAEHVIETLSPYINDIRKERIENVINGRLEGIQLAIESPSDINNALAAIRTAEALGVAHIHIITEEGSARSARKVTQGAFYWVNIHFYDHLDAFLAYAQQYKLLLAGGSVTATQTLHEVSVAQPLCILIGNEARGLSEQAIAACDLPYKIPMVGMSESMNLSVSAAISLYDTTTRKREQIGKNGDLCTQSQQHTRAHYYLNSVSPRLSQALLK